MDDPEVTRTLHIPEELCQRVETALPAARGRLDDLVVAVLEELAGKALEVDAHEEAFLVERLEGLGYL